MRTEDEVREQLAFMERVSAVTSDADESYATLLWLVGQTDESPTDRWRDYLS